MKHLTRTLTLLTLAALTLAGCADTADTGNTVAGDRPRPTTAATTKAEPEPEPPVVAEIVWATRDYDPWFERDIAEPLPMGQLYYQLDSSLAEGQSVDENTRYVMSFTYITADYYRFSLEDYLKDRGFQQHVYQSDQEPSHYMLFDLTEEEIQTITPESVQVFYDLDAAPDVVGIHRYMSESGQMYKGHSHVNSEQFWYRTDLMWGVGYLSDDVKQRIGEVYFYEELDRRASESRGWTADTKCAVVVCIDGITEGQDDYFVSREIDILPFEYLSSSPVFLFGQQVVIEITLGDLWEITLEDMESFYGCDLMVTCFLAVPPSPTDIDALQE
ncbi:MAG: hypothetical protein IJX76_08260 [Clostridia bacterium]|nr:hypothetical protein [Clostridia bacterium]